jgi:hypothetical protein
MTIEELTQQIASVDSQISAIQATLAPLVEKRDSLYHARLRLVSREFIASHRITSRNVQLSSVPDRKSFWHLVEFVEWIKEHPPYKRFAEWNGKIYFTSDIFNGALPDDMCVFASDVPEDGP